MYLFLLVGTVLLIASGYSYVNTKAFIEESVSTSGTVIDLISYKTKTDNDKTITLWRPTITFVTSDEETITFTSKSSFEFSKYKIGDSAEILYNPLKPNNADINDFMSLWIACIVMFSLGTAFTSVALIYFLARYVGLWT